MDNKDLKPQVAQPVRRITIQDLLTEMVELSDEALSQVWGGRKDPDPLEIPEHFYPDPNPNRES